MGYEFEKTIIVMDQKHELICEDVRILLDFINYYFNNNEHETRDFHIHYDERTAELKIEWGMRKATLYCEERIDENF